MQTASHRSERSPEFVFSGNLGRDDRIESENLQQNALEVGQHIVDDLWKLAEKHPCIGDVRGTGLFLAVDLVTDRDKRTPATGLATKVVNELRDRGVLTGAIGPHANILKLRCPLVLTRDDADFLIGKLDAAITSLSGFVRS